MAVKSERTLDYLISVTRAFFTYYYYIYILLLVFVLLTLSVVGGLVFQIVESPPEAKIIDAIMRQRDSTIRQLQQKVKAKESKQEITLFIQLYEGQYIGAIRNGTVILDGKEEPLWTFEGSVYYCVTTFSLVGYGNLAPRTNLGRAIAIIYCGFTIPVNSLILAELGEMLLLAFEYIWMKLPVRRKKEPEKEAKNKTAPKNANQSACSCCQVTFRCSRDITDAKRHNSDPTCLRRRRAQLDSCTTQDTHNWIFCGPSQQVTDSVSDTCDRSHSQCVLSDIAGNQPQRTAASMDNFIAIMNISEMTKTQDYLWDYATNGYVETSDFIHDRWDYATNRYVETSDFIHDLWDYATNGYVETSDFIHGNFSADVSGNPWCDSVIVGASDGFGCSSFNYPVHVFPDSFMMGKYNCPDFYSRNYPNDVLEGAVISETDVSSADSCIIKPQAALCESSTHAPDSSLHGASMKGPKVTLCDFTMNESGEAKDDSAMDSFDNSQSDIAIDAPGENLDDCVVNDEVNFTDKNTIILRRSPCRLPQFQIEDSAQCAHKTDQRLSRYVRRSFSEYSLGCVTETFSNCDQKEHVTMKTCCHCSQTNSHRVSADSGYTHKHDEDEEVNKHGSDMASGIIYAIKSQNNRHDDIRRRDESEYAGVKHIRGLIKVPIMRLNEDEPSDVLTSLVLTTLNGTNKGILDIQVHIPVGILSLVDRRKPNNIHCTKLQDRAFLKEISAARTYYQNYLSEILQVGVQQYPVVLFIDKAQFSSHSEYIHGDVERRLALDRLWRNTEEKSGLDKIGMTPANLCNHPGKLRAGDFFEKNMPNESVMDKHTFLANINQPSTGQGLTPLLVSRLSVCGHTYFVSLVCPTLLFPKSSAPHMAIYHYGYLEDSTMVLPNSTIVLTQSRRMTSLTRHAIITENTSFEKVSICRECLLYVGTNYVDKNSLSGTHHRGGHASLAGAVIERDLNMDRVSVCSKTLPMLKTLQPAQVQRRCDRIKSVCHDKLSSRLCTKILQAIDTKKSTTRAKPCPGAESLLSAVAKLVLKKQVKMPDQAAMFWLSTPLRSMYIGKRVGSGIRAHFSHGQVTQQRSDGSSMSIKKSKTSKHTHRSRDRNNNVNSDDSGDDDNGEEDDDDSKSIPEEELLDKNRITSEPVLLTIATTFVFISLGASFLTKLAGNMTYFDSYWFIWISVATIGYGDIVPTEQRLFLGILAYIFIGLCLMSNLISETSLFFSVNVSKTRDITSDAIAIINTRKQLIVIQRRTERANEHWAILREKVMNRQIPHHLVEEANKYKAGLLTEEREMVRYAYKVYFKQEQKPASYFQPSVQDTATRNAPSIDSVVPSDIGQGEVPDMYTDEDRVFEPNDQSNLVIEAPPAVAQPEADVQQLRRLNVWQKIKKTFSGTKHKQSKAP